MEKNNGEMTRSNIFDKKDGSGNSYETKRVSTSAEPKESKSLQLPKIEPPPPIQLQRLTPPTTPNKLQAPAKPKMASEQPKTANVQEEKQISVSSMPKPPAEPPLTAISQTKYNSEVNIDRLIVRLLAVTSSLGLIVIGMASCSATIFGC